MAAVEAEEPGAAFWRLVNDRGFQKYGVRTIAEIARSAGVSQWTLRNYLKPRDGGKPHALPTDVRFALAVGKDAGVSELEVLAFYGVSSTPSDIPGRRNRYKRRSVAMLAGAG